MSELQILYSPEEICMIEKSITRQMDCRIEQELEKRIEQQLGTLMGMHLQEDGTFQEGILDNEENGEGKEQLVICKLFWEAEERHRHQVAFLKQQINSLQVTINQQLQQLTECEIQTAQKVKQISSLKQILSKADSRNVQLQHESYVLRQNKLMQQAQLESLRYELQQAVHSIEHLKTEKYDIIENLNQQIRIKDQAVETATEENTQFWAELMEIQKQLNEQIEKRQTNLITFNIEVGELQEQYGQWMDMHQKINKIHSQNRKIVSLLLTLKQQLTVYKLSDIQSQLQQYQHQGIPFEEYFKLISTEVAQIITYLDEHSERKTTILNELANCQKIISKQQAQLFTSKQLNSKLQAQIRELTVVNTEMSSSINKITKDNYQVLFELTHGKQRVEKQLEEAKLCSSSRQVQINKLEAQNRQIAALQRQIEELKEINRALQEHLEKVKQYLLSSKQGYQGQQKDVMKNLFQRQASLTLEIATLKTSLRQIQLSYDKRTQEFLEMRQCYEQAVQNSSHLREQCQSLQNKMGQQIKQKYETIVQLKTQVNRLSKKGKAEGVMTQTEDTSQVRRQRVLNNSIPDNSLSHSFKQNNSRENNSQNHKFRLKQCSHCPHLQKIGILNELLNYIMNHLKGYQGSNIRQGSWFTYQIQKYGSEYSAKVMDEHHLAVKMKNKRIICELRGKESNVDRLLKEFQGIMEYYFSKGEQFSRSKEDVWSVSSREVGKLNKTVAKVQRAGAIFNQSRQLYR